MVIKKDQQLPNAKKRTPVREMFDLERGSSTAFKSDMYRNALRRDPGICDLA